MNITLSQLIDEVREELLSPRKSFSSDAIYPFLFIEEVEIEVEVAISGSLDGSGKVNIQVLEIANEVSLSKGNAHRIKIKMTPLMTKDEIIQQLQLNGDRTWEKVKHTTFIATTKEPPISNASD